MTRMVKITQTFLIDVEAGSAQEAERIAHEMMANDQIDFADPTSYSVEDKGEGSWDD